MMPSRAPGRKPWPSNVTRARSSHSCWRTASADGYGGALHTGQALHYNAAPLGNMYVSPLRALGVDTTTFGVDGVAPLDGVNV